MDKKIYSHEKLVAFRRATHQQPETGFNEFKTRERIKAFLVDCGVDPTTFREMAVTALVVDIRGKKAPEGKDRCIALRADMDGLSMEEDNKHLPYRSEIPVAHMCGHDGHMTCLLALVMRFIDMQDEIPSNKSVRLLFQPSQEGPTSGAQRMVAEGCMEGVDEVYGYHNWPSEKAGKLWVMPGPIMTAIVKLTIKIIGTMGHGSEPDQVKDCIKGAVSVYQKIQSYIGEVRKDNPMFVASFPVFQAGTRSNVFGETARLEGTVRSYDAELSKKVVDHIESIVKEVEKDGYKYDFYATPPGLPIINTSPEAQHVARVAEKIYGKQNVGQGPLPVKASEDFGHFCKARPGAFFFLSSAKTDEKYPMLHSNNYDFNEDLIEKAGEFYMALLLDRFELSA